MEISIDSSDGIPIYRQIVNQIRCMVASGALKPGVELTPVRRLSSILNTTPNTVVKAYDILENAGVIFKRRGAGTYVTNTNPDLVDEERTHIMEKRIRSLVSEARSFGLDSEKLLTLVKDRLDEVEKMKIARSKR